MKKLKIKKNERKIIGIVLLLAVGVILGNYILAFTDTVCHSPEESMAYAIERERTTLYTCVVDSTNFCVQDSLVVSGREGKTHEAYCYTSITQLHNGDCGPNDDCLNTCTTNEDCAWLEGQYAQYGSDGDMQFPAELECVGGFCKSYYRPDSPSVIECGNNIAEDGEDCDTCPEDMPSGLCSQDGGNGDPEPSGFNLGAFLQHYMFQLIALVLLLVVGIVMLVI